MAFMHGVCATQLELVRRYQFSDARYRLAESENSNRGWFIPSDCMTDQHNTQCLDYLFEIGVKMKLAGLSTVV